MAAIVYDLILPVVTAVLCFEIGVTVDISKSHACAVRHCLARAWLAAQDLAESSSRLSGAVTVFVKPQ